MLEIKQHKTLLLLFLLAVITFSVYAGNISYTFAYTDDYHEIVLNPLVKPESPVTQIFNIKNFHFYAPLKHLANYLLNAVSYNNPHISHLLSNIIHIFNVLLCFLCVLLISKRYTIAFFTALAFGIAPATSAAVNELAARGHILSAFFALAATYFYLLSNVAGAKYGQIKLFRIIALIAFILGLLTWPTIILLPVFFMVVKKNSLTDLLPFFIASLAAAALNFYISYSSGALELAGTAFDNDLLFSVSLLGGSAVYKLPLIISKYVIYCFYPPQVDIIFSPFLPAFRDFKFYYLSHFAALAALCGVYYKTIKINKAYGAFLALTVCFLAPGIIFVYKTELLSLRYLYLPSIGIFAAFFVFVHYYASRTSKRGLKNLLYAALCLWLLGLGVNTYMRKQAWQNPHALLSSLINSDGISEVWGWFLAVNWEADTEKKLFYMQTAREILKTKYSAGHEISYAHIMRNLDERIEYAKAAVAGAQK